MLSRHLADPEATRGLGRQLAAELLAEGQLGSAPLLLLQGDLGAGKTCLVQGLAEGLGITEAITSPTFALAHHYRGRLETERGGRQTLLVHMDLYRLESPAAADELFAQEEEEAAAAGALLAVEWPERLSFAPEPAWKVELTIAGEARRARIMPPAPPSC